MHPPERHRLRTFSHRELIRARGTLSRWKLGLRAGVSVGTIARLEQGRGKPSADTAASLGAALVEFGKLRDPMSLFVAPPDERGLVVGVKKS